MIGLLHALVGLYAKFDNLILVDKQALDGHFDVARGLFINRNHYAAFISLTLLGAITYFLKGLMQEPYQRRPLLIALDLMLSPRVIYMAAAIVGVIALMLSESRAGLFGFVSAFFIVILLVTFLDKKVMRRRVVFIILALLMTSFYVLFGDNMMVRLSTEGFSVGERLPQWEITWAAILDAPLQGFGVGSYSTVFQVYREQSDLRQVVFDQSHNEYLQIWLEQGLIGLVLFCGLVSVVLIALAKTYRNSSSTLVSAIMISVLVVILSTLAQSMVDFNLQIMNIRCFFFVIIALMYCTTSLLKKTN